MSSKASDRPSDGSPGSFSSIPDGHVAAPCPVVQIPSRGKELGVSRPVKLDTAVVGDLPSIPVNVFESGTERSTRGDSDYPISWEPFAVRDQSLIDEIRAAPLARIVTVTISVTTPREDGQHRRLVVERERLCGPVDRSDWLVLLPESPDREAGRDSGAREWQEAFDRWTAKELVKPVWEQTKEHWDLSGGRDVALADELGSLQDQWHELMLGKEVQFASEMLGLPSPAGAMLSGIVSEHALPGDTAITDLKRIVQITGIAAGFATGNLHMAHACLASYMRDVATETVSHQVEKLFTREPGETAQRARSAEPDIRRRKASRDSTARPEAEPDIRPPGIGKASVDWRKAQESSAIITMRMS
jgi:hypothetical protein